MNNKKIIAIIKKKLPWILLSLPIAIYFIFGTIHLAEFTTADEHFWFYERTPQYWRAIADKEWKKTYINDKPGIAVALISGAGLLWDNHPEKKEMKDYMPANPERTKSSLTLNRTFRLPVLIFSALFSFYLFFVLKKITRNDWLSLFAVSLILLSPTLLGISQIVNPDSFLWSFSFATILSFCALAKTREKKFFILAPLFLALSLLSKYSASVLYPFLFAIILMYIFTRDRNEKGKFIETKEMRKVFFAFFSTVIGSLIFFALFMPAVFVKVKYLFEGTVGYPGMPQILIPLAIVALLIIADSFWNKGSIVEYIFAKIINFRKYIRAIIYGSLALIFILLIINAFSGFDFLRIHDIPFDIRQNKDFIKGTTLLQKIFLEFRQLTFSLQPLVIIGILWIWIRSIFKRTRYDFLILTCSSFLFVYYAAVISQDLLANIRYSIILYPLAIILGALGIWDFSNIFGRNISRYWVFLGIIIFSIFSLWSIRPFYFNYTNSLLPKKYIITGAWGYGGYEAAAYINSLPNSENLRVWADYQGTCEFIKGICMTKNYKYNPEKYTFDYFVFSRRGQILDKSKKGSTKKPVEDKPVWELFIGGREQNFIRVYKAK